MKRRKTLIGLGALATSGVAAVGTGAFDLVSARRDVSIEVADDADALLGLDPTSLENSAYAVESDGIVEIDVTENTETSDDVFTDGVSPYAVTQIEEVIEVTNQGTQDVEISIVSDDLSVGDPFVLIATDVPEQDGPLGLLQGADGDRPIISPGHSFALGFIVDAETDDKIETLEDEIFDGTGLPLTITADTEEVNGS